MGSFYPVSDFFVEKILDKWEEKLLGGMPVSNRYRQLVRRGTLGLSSGKGQATAFIPESGRVDFARNTLRI